MKRLLDLILSIMAFTLILPLMIPVMLILRFTGEGEVFYLQQRVGKSGKNFGLMKFATMVKNSPNVGGGLLTQKNDPRILPFGKFLRKTKINELPQLINIIKGEMSIVGPRPQAVKHFEVFPEHVKKEIITLTPGLTGIGSIVFRDEETILHESGRPYDDFYNNVIAPYKGELEIWYKKNQSMILDLKLIFLTAWIILSPKSSLYKKILKNLPAVPLELKLY
ncbi:MAG: sugar transferase [Spirochaetia bacterium]|nr:sugar transferase [Spirochaetia bacterium]